MLEYVSPMIPNEDPGKDDFDISLASLLCFATGSEHPPPLGFSQNPEITFECDCSRFQYLWPTLCLPLALGDPGLI